MLSDRVSNPGTLTYESGALLIALRGLATELQENVRVFAKQGRQGYDNTLFSLKTAKLKIIIQVL